MVAIVSDSTLLSKRNAHYVCLQGPNNVLGELEGISTVVQLGHTLLRHDLEESLKAASMHGFEVGSGHMSITQGLTRKTLVNSALST